MPSLWDGNAGGRCTLLVEDALPAVFGMRGKLWRSGVSHITPLTNIILMINTCFCGADLMMPL